MKGSTLNFSSWIQSSLIISTTMHGGEYDIGVQPFNCKIDTYVDDFTII
jgi:hypothetical protein